MTSATHSHLMQKLKIYGAVTSPHLQGAALNEAQL